MKVICQRKALLDACQAVSVATTKGSTKPVLSCVKLDGGRDSLFVCATDLEMSVRYQILGVQCDAFTAVVNCQKLTAVLKEISDEQVEIVTNEDGISISTMSGLFDLPVQSPDEFPDIPSVDEAPIYQEVKAGDLRHAWRLSSFAMAKQEDSRFAITGLLWAVVGDKVRLVTTDTRRLAVVDIPATMGGEQDEKLMTILPSKAMTLLLNAATDDGELIRVVLAKSGAFFQLERAVIHTRLIEGRFPPYANIIPKKHTSTCVAKVKDFLSKVRQSAITTDDESRRIDFEFGTETKLQSCGPAAGKSLVRFTPTSYKGEPVKVAFDPAYLADYLKVLDQDSEVTLKLNDEKKPSVFEHSGNIYLIMSLAG